MIWYNQSKYGVDKMKKKGVKIIVIVIAVCIAIALGIAVFIINMENNSYSRPDYQYTAIIYHSEMKGMDAGTEYTYYIYRSSTNKKDYYYIKSKSSITIAGSGEEMDIGSGPIRNRNDLKRIEQDIKNDSRKDSETYVFYIYENKGKLEDIDELGDRLFK